MALMASLISFNFIIIIIIIIRKDKFIMP